MNRIPLYTTAGAGLILALSVAGIGGAAKKPAPAKKPAAKKTAAAKPKPAPPKPTPGSGGNAPGVITADKTFKNIRVLKDLPADQLQGVMMEYSQALGVMCNFCHKNEDFAQDTPHKNAAREMILLTRRLNDKEPSVKKKMTCFTCHRGEAEPSNTPEQAAQRAKNKPGGSPETGTPE